mmetsp:Transcript_111513/g.197483  ORF Transcript_111513/g.197483 Transcript_111513/m.197483 type:complete len:105 (-) Transcript_111513:1135-1449(-)
MADIRSTSGIIGCRCRTDLCGLRLRALNGPQELRGVFACIVPRGLGRGLVRTNRGVVADGVTLADGLDDVATYGIDTDGAVDDKFDIGNCAVAKACGNVASACI